MRLSSRSNGLISFRAAAILAMALVVGAIVGALTYWSARSIIQALLAVGTTIGGTSDVLDRLLGGGPAATVCRLEHQQSCSCGGERSSRPDRQDSGRRRPEPG
ncbi:hypothetical protein [Actinomadura mexicana]|uniref:Uncharacterized protein n=1 Tax=Actinomadura mexicana TaxID=134959 RepID=A0A238Z0X0_9ACTN|nr:hypothetical protein [Actinomadura mexicana]SNR76986.1 hypothetical protein SAMN06265355_106393 [Actinomadura mexicana]